MNLPDDVRYTTDHEWIRLGDDGRTAEVGITDFAQGELGDIVFVELEPVGTELAKDSPFGTVEAVKTVSELFMPVSGKIVAHNDSLEQSPEQVNSDPYGRGWMIRVELSDPAEFEELLTADAYRDSITDH